MPPKIIFKSHVCVSKTEETLDKVDTHSYQCKGLLLTNFIKLKAQYLTDCCTLHDSSKSDSEMFLMK